MNPKNETPLSEVETIKAQSRFLRGTLAASVEDPVTSGIPAADVQLLKFHGSYLQDDRDLREERRQQKLEPAYMFMLRTRLPGGMCTPTQWLALDELARTHGTEPSGSRHGRRSNSTACSSGTSSRRSRE